MTVKKYQKVVAEYRRSVRDGQDVLDAAHSSTFMVGDEAISKAKKVRDCCIDRLQNLDVFPFWSVQFVCKGGSRDARIIGLLEGSLSPIGRCRVKDWEH